MLSSVSKLVDKAFVTGFFLPALLAVYTALNVLHCPSWLAPLCSTKPDNSFAADITYAALIVWTVALMLLFLNYGLYRLFEGYVPPVSWLTPLKTWHQGRWQRRKEKQDEGDDALAQGEKRKQLLNDYPTDVNDFLPTSFGNALRAFERYPAEVYGIDTVSGWLRLGAVIPSAYQQLINDARSQVDFFVNTCFLAIVLCAASLAKLAEEHVRHVQWEQCDAPVLWKTAIASIVVATVAYYWSIGRVVAWGDLVKSAFDLYLPALAKQVGYALPPSEAKQREFWKEFSWLMLYRIQLPDRKWKRADPPAAAKGHGAAGDVGDPDGDDG